MFAPPGDSLRARGSPLDAGRRSPGYLPAGSAWIHEGSRAQTACLQAASGDGVDCEARPVRRLASTLRTIAQIPGIIGSTAVYRPGK
jgi:hypothetical protein